MRTYPGHEGHDVEMVQGYKGPDDAPDADRPYPFCHTCGADLSHLLGHGPKTPEPPDAWLDEFTTRVVEALRSGEPDRVVRDALDKAYTDGFSDGYEEGRNDEAKEATE